jgi:hypothetical protein
MAEQLYRIRRNFQRPEHRAVTIKTDLTLEEAQAHCQDPETSSSTYTLAKNKRITERKGPWFDGYEKQ